MIPLFSHGFNYSGIDYPMAACTDAANTNTRDEKQKVDRQLKLLKYNTRLRRPIYPLSMTQITPEAFNRLTEALLPMAFQQGFRAENIGNGAATVRLPYNDGLLRSGGTIMGPAMMWLADFAMYAALMGAIGRVELAMTTNLNINFLRRPKQSDVIGDCRMLKLGKRLAVLEVTLFSEGEEEPIAHVTGTYSIPPGITQPGLPEGGK